MLQRLEEKLVAEFSSSPTLKGPGISVVVQDVSCSWRAFSNSDSAFEHCQD